MITSADITNFINSVCYSVQFDGIPFDEITLDFCKYDLDEMKKHCDPDDIELLEKITPEMLHDEYIRLWKEHNKGKVFHVIREVPADEADLQFYFEDDGLTSASGDYNNTLFIVHADGFRRYSGFNIDEYKKVMDIAEQVHDDFSAIEEGLKAWYGSNATYKDIMIDNGIIYNSHKCHLLREWSKMIDDRIGTYDIADFLTITTGKKWAVSSASGYCQGDYVEMVYCEEQYKNGVQRYGDIWLGAAKEFRVIELDENGKEIDSCYGYIVADCEARTDEDYKTKVCELACIDPEFTRLEMIDSWHTYKKYEYRTF